MANGEFNVQGICKRINISSSSEYIISIGGILCGDILFVDAVISKDLPSGSFQTLDITLPNSAEGRGIVYPLSFDGSAQVNTPSGSFSFGTANDKAIIGSTRISNSSITILLSASATANFFVSFVVLYLKK